MTLPTQDPAPVQPPAPPATQGEQKPAEHMVPKSRLDELIAKLDEANKKAAALERAQQDAEKKRLEEANQYKELYEKTQAEISNLKPKAEQVEEYEAVLKEQLAAEVATLPEDLQDIVPAGLSTKDQLRWLSKNKPKFMKAEPFDIGAGKQGSKRPVDNAKLTTEELEIAKQYHMTPEEYAKYKG